MTEPKRWSSPSSDVDPVLRSVLLYARDLQPDSQQLQAMLRGSSEPRRVAPKRRRLVAFVIASAAAACAGVAWASFATGFFLGAAAPGVSSAAPPARAHAPASALASATRAAPPASALASATQAAPPASASAGRVPPLAVPPLKSGPLSIASASTRAASPPALTASSASASSASSTPLVAASALAEQDAALLQQARRLVASEPARALTLTRDHELHFPGSPLTEERQALRIEALARLGRRAEAERELATFDQRFPRSIYRHRLRALLP